jgi:hypothetical protein
VSYEMEILDARNGHGESVDPLVGAHVTYHGSIESEHGQTFLVTAVTAEGFILQRRNEFMPGERVTLRRTRRRSFTPMPTTWNTIVLD